MGRAVKEAEQNAAESLENRQLLCSLGLSPLMRHETRQYSDFVPMWGARLCIFAISGT